MTIRGNFETHLTIASPDSGTLGALRTFAVGAGLKVTHILLDRGQQPSQLMLTEHSAGTLDAALAAAREWRARLAAHGWEVRRTKIEVDAHSPAAPVDKKGAMANPGDWYFECHVKLLLDSLSDLACLDEVARRSAAHLSRNAFRVRPDGHEERFLTQRSYAVGRDEALGAMEVLTRELQQNDFAILECEAEYVVFDSNVAMDAGWLDAP